MPQKPDFPPAPDFVSIKTALISLSDKTGLIEAANALRAKGVKLISTGGTKSALEGAGIEVTDVAEVTGFPEMMDGRVKTLHPLIHGGILAYRDAPSHAKAMIDHKITPIDLVWIDLYPFEKVKEKGGDWGDLVENIDIGGPAMIRSSAKNHAYVSVCVDAKAIEILMASFEKTGGTTASVRKQLMLRAFERTASYDAMIAESLAGFEPHNNPDRLSLSGQLIETMRYGENPHQKAGFYKTGDNRIGVATAKLIQGKALSYNNVCDTDAALELVAEWQDKPACVIVKHANPCGVALGDDVLSAYRRALACDPVSAFGGIIAFNRPIDAKTAEEVVKLFTEVVIAPYVEPDALTVFAAKKNLRLLTTEKLPDPVSEGWVYRSVAGGFLIQSRDTTKIRREDLKIVTKRQPTEAELEDMIFAFTVAKHVKSNAIVYAKNGQTAGIGAGQMNRKDSARIASLRAQEASELMGLAQSLAQGSACASEAFFPFADGLIEAAAAGASAIIQPGGSIKDAEVIEAADARGLTMAFTGVRVFKH
jgi:phosphoribosylaminoimidazolecarboxamide formyltransferase / IMP cyclohydrolase